MKKCNRWLAIQLVIAIVITGVLGMSYSFGSEIDLKWEWPVDRKPDYRLIAEVAKIKEGAGGLFGIKNHPSMDTGYGDAMRLNVTVKQGPTDYVGKDLFMILPNSELGDVKQGDRVVMGLLKEEVSKKQVCICLQKIPPDLSGAALETWLAAWKCGGDSTK